MTMMRILLKGVQSPCREATDFAKIIAEAKKMTDIQR